jgi:hypothetical protein
MTSTSSSGRSSTTAPGSESERLAELHETRLDHLSTDSEAMMDYLMSCQSYLKESDLSGWISTFAPELIPRTVEPPAKRRRCSPNAVLWAPHPPCGKCRSTEIIEDVKEGCVVCTACGMVQTSVLIQSEHGAHTTIAKMTSLDRYVVHHYSRVVYFRSFMQSLQGDTRPQYSPEDVLVLRRVVGGIDVTKITPDVVQCALRVSKLTKFRRHKVRFAEILSDGHFKAPLIPSDVFYKLLKLFRRVEVAWEQVVKKQNTRRVFISYPYVYYQLCHHLGLPDLCGQHHLLKSRARLQILHKLYGRVCKRAGLTCKLDVFR